MWCLDLPVIMGMNDNRRKKFELGDRISKKRLKQFLEQKYKFDEEWSGSCIITVANDALKKSRHSFLLLGNLVVEQRGWIAVGLKRK